MPEKIEFTLNGKTQSVTTDPTRPLLEVLREDCQTLGPKFGCGEAQCGACSVLVGDSRVFSCRAPVKSVSGKSVTTIEGLSDGEHLHPVQQAFLDAGAYQCGYCTVGMIVAAVALLKETAHPTDQQIVEGMNKNLCRCCSYSNIITAVKKAAGAA
jgi:aerobic-type carbon monoxide dehydrogenase small subunit (CoxS/CutS family)